jgi:uroporphyrinogen decarboxylase
MNGRERILIALGGHAAGTSAGTPICPILHTTSARLEGVPIGRYASDAALMAECVLHAYRLFGYDGVQLSLGVATEAEALGADTRQPPDGLPVIQAPLLERQSDLAHLTLPDMERDGRLPLFAEAVSKVHQAIGQEAWIIATIRGPLVMASQLRGVEQTLIDLLESPEWMAELLAFATEVGIAFGRLLVAVGADAIAIGEATCSPDFIAPRLYREQIRRHHERLVSGLHQAGCRTTVMHICGQALPIVGDVASTGTDVMDIDWQVDPARAFAVAGERMALRGNIDPVDVLLYGTPAQVEEAVRQTLARVGRHRRFILSSGCDVPPDTPPEQIHALVRAGRRGARAS